MWSTPHTVAQLTHAVENGAKNAALAALAADGPEVASSVLASGSEIYAILLGQLRLRVTDENGGEFYGEALSLSFETDRLLPEISNLQAFNMITSGFEPLIDLQAGVEDEVVKSICQVLSEVDLNKSLSLTGNLQLFLNGNMTMIPLDKHIIPVADGEDIPPLTEHVGPAIVHQETDLSRFQPYQSEQNLIEEILSGKKELIVPLERLTIPLDQDVVHFSSDKEEVVCVVELQTETSSSHNALDNTSDLEDSDFDTESPPKQNSCSKKDLQFKPIIKTRNALEYDRMLQLVAQRKLNPKAQVVAPKQIQISEMASPVQTCVLPSLNLLENDSNIDVMGIRLCCPECDQVVRGPQGVVEHFLAARCPECGWSSNSVGLLQQHVMDVHGGCETFCSGNNMCSECGITTQSAFFMAVHILQDHPDRRVFFCDLEPCAPDQVALFGSYEDLGVHMAQLHRVKLPSAPDGDGSVSQNMQKQQRPLSPSIAHFNKLTSEVTELFEQDEAAQRLKLHHANLRKKQRQSSKKVEVVLKKSTKEMIHQADSDDDDDMFEEGEEDGAHHKCPHCAKYFSTMETFECHLKSVHGGGISDITGEEFSLPCPVRGCSDRFKGKAELEEHLNRQHAKGFPLGVREKRCPHCDFSSFYPSSVAMHMKTMHKDKLPVTDNARKHGCPVEGCRSQFKSLKAMEVHLRLKHKGNVLLPGKNRCYCPHCSDPFQNQRSLRMHIIKSHNERLPVACTMCPQRFLNERWLRKHVEQCHCSTVCHLCTKCRVMLPAGENSREATAYVEGHRLACDGYVHSYVTFVCTHCKASFQEERRLKWHMEQCRFMKIVSCTECDDHFANEAGLSIHTRRAHYYQCTYQCHLCRLGFHKARSYASHCEKVHGRPPDVRQLQQAESVSGSKVTSVVANDSLEVDEDDDLDDLELDDQFEDSGDWGSSRTTERSKQVTRSNKDRLQRRMDSEAVLRTDQCITEELNEITVHEDPMYGADLNEPYVAYYSTLGMSNQIDNQRVTEIQLPLEAVDVLMSEQPSGSGQSQMQLQTPGREGPSTSYSRSSRRKTRLPPREDVHSNSLLVDVEEVDAATWGILPPSPRSAKLARQGIFRNVSGSWSDQCVVDEYLANTSGAGPSRLLYTPTTPSKKKD